MRLDSLVLILMGILAIPRDTVISIQLHNCVARVTVGGCPMSCAFPDLSALKTYTTRIDGQPIQSYRALKNDRIIRICDTVDTHSSVSPSIGCVVFIDAFPPSLNHSWSSRLQDLRHASDPHALDRPRLLWRPLQYLL